MCTGILSYVTQFDRYYCFRCNAYPPEGVFMETKVEPTPSVTPEPAPAQSALVVAEPAIAEQPKPTPVEPGPQPVATQVPVEQETQPVKVETPAEPPSEAEIRAEEEIPPEESVTPVAKPPLVRAEIRDAKKPTLMDLCKAYNLDPTGTKEQLRERLLSYVDEEEAEREPEQKPQAILVEIPMEFPQTSEERAVAPKQAEPVAEPKAAPRKVITAAPRMIPEMPKRVVESPPPAAMPTTPVVADTVAPTPIVEEPFVTPVFATTSAPEVVTVEPSTIPTAKVEHPCPTCGRELTYISQYNRWYCYSCRAYAPRAKSRFACPNCGAALRWIGQYERWWCDACRRYAPADLPKPERTPILGASVTSVARGASMAAATIVHRHRSPGSGIGLVGFGMVLFVVYEILVDLPAALASGTGSLIGPDVAFGLRFFAFVFVAVGAIMGLYAVRDRR